MTLNLAEAIEERRQLVSRERCEQEAHIQDQVVTALGTILSKEQASALHILYDSACANFSYHGTKYRIVPVFGGRGQVYLVQEGRYSYKEAQIVSWDITWENNGLQQLSLVDGNCRHVTNAQELWNTILDILGEVNAKHRIIHYMVEQEDADTVPVFP